jgi:enoyl-CoA hydratase/carnithine racemase
VQTVITVTPEGSRAQVGDTRVAEIVLESPPVNALSDSFIADVTQAFGTVAASGALVVVLRSALPGTFVAGADLLALVDRDLEGSVAFVRNIQGLIRTIMAAPQVVVVGVHGHCLGGGLEIALAADLVVAADDASLGLPEVTLGIMAAAGGVHQLARRIGAGRARAMLLTGRPVAAHRALEIGLVDDVVPRADLGDAVLALAERVAGFPELAVRETKALASSVWDRSVDDGLELEMQAWTRMRATDETQAALRAFADRHSG